MPMRVDAPFRGLRGLVVLGVVGVAVAMYAISGGQRFGSGAPDPCRVEVAVEVLEVRGGPDTALPVLSTAPRGAVLDAQRVVQNGFRLLADDRWVAQEGVATAAGADCG
ncbi:MULTISPECIES: hypothetical protein [Actinosynnema]|uniref:SH3 domain-containing protein n=1 Tax=Actinosynnema pretiosum TaxID=42197 RepID=A0A290ZEC2_9PSEU|nr:hypothetical protein [Actinosynnema pretiosum]ATE57322.1 hypothetical protein CNX65_31785 [Actinosynnema pretiosum]